MVSEIPKQYNDFKFCRIDEWNKWKNAKSKEIIKFEGNEYARLMEEGIWKPLGKKPSDLNWNNLEVSLEEIKQWILRGFNYGVLTGVNGLGVLDDDTKDNQLLKLALKSFGETFRVRDHLYFKLKNWDGKKVIFYDKDGKHCGELQGKGQQVVGANSIHPSGEIYEIKNNLQIKEIDVEIFKSIFQDYIPELNKPIIKNIERTYWEGEDIKDIPITNVISLGGLSDMGNGCYQGSHPIHGSSGGMNFRVNTLSNTWYCFRCSSGGSSPEMIAVVEGIIDCNQAGRGCLAGDRGSQVIKVARDKYGLKAPEQKEKVPMGWALSVNIKKLAERYKFTKCMGCNIPFEFDERLGFFKCKSCGDFGGLKTFADKILNEYNKKNATKN